MSRGTRQALLQGSLLLPCMFTILDGGLWECYFVVSRGNCCTKMKKLCLFKELKELMFSRNMLEVRGVPGCGAGSSRMDVQQHLEWRSPEPLLLRQSGDKAVDSCESCFLREVIKIPKLHKTVLLPSKPHAWNHITLLHATGMGPRFLFLLFKGSGLPRVCSQQSDRKIVILLH